MDETSTFIRCAALLLWATSLAGCSGGGSTPSGTTHASSASPTPAATASPQGETGGAATAFAASVGVDVHMSTQTYAQNPAAVAALVAQLGVRHLRDSTFPGQQNMCALFQSYAGNGVRFDFIVTPGETDAQLQSWQSCSAPAAEAYEGYNEYDLSNDPNWPQTLRTAQQQIYAYAHGIGLPAVGPALISGGDYGEVGPVPADYGNFHDYFAGRNPGNPGFGGTFPPFGTYGSLAYDMNIARQTTGQAPLWSTETGYGDAPGSIDPVPPVTKMHYSLRTLFLHWNAGVPRTYFYELLDENNGDFGSFGLATPQLQPKPAFYAISNLLAHLAGSQTTTAALPYSLTAPSTVDHTLLTRSPTQFTLALWEEVPEWNPVTNQLIAVTPQAVTLNFATRPQAVSVTTFNTQGQTSTATQTPAASLTLRVDGSPSLVDITI
jgi:hypothetical protein